MTRKNSRLAQEIVQSDSTQATPSALLARILDIETVASSALAALQKAEDDAAAAASAPAKPADNVVTIEALQAQLDALKAAQK